MEEHFKDAQRDILNGLRKLRDEGGFLERKASLKALRELRQDVFDLSYKDIHEEAVRLEKQLCKDTNNKWDDGANMCQMKED